MAEPSSESAILVLCLLGPTGVGKTDLALRLAREFPIEIVSMDSAMVYRYMDIGTAKPDSAARARSAHHLIDIRDPWEAYSAGLFRGDALRVIREIHERRRVPLLAGGTMLYFRALCRGLATLPQADAGLRARIDEQARKRGWRSLHAELQAIDPVAASRIGPLDRQRIQRALEVYWLTGRPISRLQRGTEPAGDIRFFRIALMPRVRQDLDHRLEERFAAMMRSGLVAEVERLMALPRMSADRPAMRAVGYRQVWKYLSGEMPLSEARRQAVIATRRLAKRQLTWLRSETVDMAVDALARDTPSRVSSAVHSLGVSRLAKRCNIIDQPLECREHGV